MNSILTFVFLHTRAETTILVTILLQQYIQCEM